MFPFKEEEKEENGVHLGHIKIFSLSPEFYSLRNLLWVWKNIKE